MTVHGKVVYLEIPPLTRKFRRPFTHQSSAGAPVLAAMVLSPSTTPLAAWAVPGGGIDHRSRRAGVLVYVNVDDVSAAMATVEAAGGEIVQAVGGDPGELTARFRDPYGQLGGSPPRPIK